MKITALIDNKTSDESRFFAEHGLSFWIEKGDCRIVFDAGATDLAARNAAALGVELSDADFAVCSHGHYDHGCGFVSLIQAESIRRFVTGRGFFAPKYTRQSDGEIKSAGTGITQALLETHRIAHAVCGELLWLSAGVWAIGGFERTFPFERTSGKFLLQDGDDWRVDTFADEIALAVENDLDDGVTLIVGCSHPGIINMLTTVQQRLKKRIAAVIGGTHLMEADDARIHATLHALKQMRVARLGLSHCSGASVIDHIKENPSIDGFYVASGDTICL